MIAPWLTVRNGEQTLSFYHQAFGAKVVYRLEDPGAGVVARLSKPSGELKGSWGDGLKIVRERDFTMRSRGKGMASMT
jgi:hypothetical protein